ncbi:hypothetical protein JB92DRAFT_2776632 [Gautieria morchelliformis]|nr:hypothetical protein JB92DRAFT_2776632 [Gautieria morchelliformis]
MDGNSPQYQQAVEYIQIWKYQLAMDKLEGLVVQRLFELTKGNVLQTGYKLRTHISKALQTPSRAIQRALKTYNDAAQKLDPPRVKLSWSEIVEYITLAEFELLQSEARDDIHNLNWAETRHRESTISHLKILRAQEEIQQLNIEVKQVSMWMVHDKAQLQAAIDSLQTTDLLMAEALMEFTSDQKHVNAHVQATLKHIYELVGRIHR